ncbi:MAG: acyl carrier protein [Gammaproteobacteria bacterium]|nr:MAG: acyl carrier protein [Gammaproteobacteria bacterium]
MSQQDTRAMLAEALASVAPEADFDTLREDEDLRDALELDSMDFFNFIVAVHKATGIDIPERDYPKLTTLAGALAYLAR